MFFNLDGEIDNMKVLMGKLEIGNCESCDGYVNNYPKIKTETTNLVMLCIPVHAVFQSP